MLPRCGGHGAKAGAMKPPGMVSRSLFTPGQLQVQGDFSRCPVGAICSAKTCPSRGVSAGLSSYLRARLFFVPVVPDALEPFDLQPLDVSAYSQDAADEESGYANGHGYMFRPQSEYAPN